MSRYSSTLVFILTVLLSFGMAFGQTSSIYVSNVSGGIGTDGPDPDALPDTLSTGQAIVFTIAYQNNSGSQIIGATNGFRLYSPDGASWSDLVIDTLNILPTTGAGWKTRFDLVCGFSIAVTDGVSPDTVGIGGVSLFGPGFPTGFDFNVATITIPAPGINSAHNGKTVCLDSSSYDPALVEWIWSSSGGPITPAWAGPHCFKIRDPNAPVIVNLITTPDSIAFTATEGGANPAPQSLNINSDGTPLAFTLADDQLWISTSIVGGTTPATANVSVNIAGLAPGFYKDTITVTSATATNSPKYVIVTLSIAAVPKFLDVLPDTLYYTAQQNAANPVQQRFRITETGGFPIAYTASETSLRLTLSKTSGTTPDSVGVNVSIAGLIPAVYIDSVTVTSTAAGNSPIKEYIKTTITTAPKFLEVLPDTLKFTAQEGGANPIPNTFGIIETGNSPIAFALAENTTWFSLDISGGTTPGVVLITPIIAGLTPDTYYGNVTVTSAEASNSPVTEVIRLIITPKPRLILASPTTFAFSMVANSPPFFPVAVNVTDSFNVGIPYTVGDGVAWANVSPNSGTTPGSFQIIADTAAIATLIPGYYLDTILISAATAANSPVRIFISLNILAVPNDPPVLAAIGNRSVNENVNINFAVSATDPDATTPNFITSTLPPGATFVDNSNGTGTFDWTPTFAQSGAYPIIFRATDGTLVDTEIVIITVNNVNQAPVLATIGDRSVNEGANLNVVVSAADADATTPGFTTTALPAGATFVNNLNGTATFNWTPTFIQNGNYSITFRASDGTLVDTEIVVITVNEAGNQLPVLAPIGAKSVNENALLTFGVTATDAESTLIISTSTLPAGASFTPSGNGAGTFSWTPTLAQAGTHFVTFKATDAQLAVDSEVVQITVSDANQLPIIAAIGNYSIFEGDLLAVSVTATDADNDQLFLSISQLPNNASFFDSGNGNGYLIFHPDFNQAGLYPLTVYATDSKDTTSEDFIVQVTDKVPGTEGDTVQVGSVPAVPGQQVVVPINIANSCDVYGMLVPFTWAGGNYIKLDSIKFNQALVGGISNKGISIDIDGWIGEITFSVTGSENPLPPGRGLLANLYFSVSPATPQGVYGVNPGLTVTTFTRICGGGAEIINPVIPGGGGNIIVDTSNVYVCGYVVDQNSVGVQGATVELWPNFPCDGPIQNTMTNGDGAYAFTGFTLGSFDLYAFSGGQSVLLNSQGNTSGQVRATYNDAYYPKEVHVNFGDNGIMLVLNSVPIITPVDNWVDYFCGVNTLFGCPLPVGSIVEVCDPSNLVCGRQFVTQAGVYRFLPVYRDSSGSVEDEGATTGDNLRFYINGIQALTDGNTIYPAAYDTVRVCLTGGARLTKECILNTGWNLTSWNLDTDTDSIETVLGSLDGCIQVVLGFEQGGRTYVPGMDLFNTLKVVDHLSGYWIKLGANCNHTLSVAGVPVDQNTPIPVNRGWNLVSYLPNDIQTVGNALYSLAGNLQIAYTFNSDSTPPHLVYVPGMNPVFNNLDEMEPCFGYWLKDSLAGVLTYPTAGGAMPKIDWPIVQEALGSQDKLVEPTRNWVNMYSYNLTVDGNTVSVGAAVTAHNLSGNVIGYYEMKKSGTFGFMPVYADAENETVAGIKKGESFYLAVDGIKTAEEFIWSEQGALIEVATLTTGGGNNLPEEYVLEQNYPNPFNPSTTISFSLPVASQATLEIFNLLGQKVATPFNGMAEAGGHDVVWDGKTITGETASSGIYLYRLTAGHFVKTLKMTLVK